MEISVRFSSNHHQGIAECGFFIVKCLFSRMDNTLFQAISEVNCMHLITVLDDRNEFLCSLILDSILRHIYEAMQYHSMIFHFVSFGKLQRVFHEVSAIVCFVFCFTFIPRPKSSNSFPFSLLCMLVVLLFCRWPTTVESLLVLMAICCVEGATRCLTLRGFSICLGSNVDDVVRMPNDWDSIIELLNPAADSDLNPSDPSWCGGGNFSLLLVVFALSRNFILWYAYIHMFIVQTLKVEALKLIYNWLEIYSYVNLQLCICFRGCNRPAWSNAGVCFLLNIAISSFANNVPVSTNINSLWLEINP